MLDEKRNGISKYALKGASSMPPRLKAGSEKSKLPLSERILAPKTEVAKMCGISYISVWRACKTGRFKTVVVGKRELVRLDSI